jgi:hypothetical protein
MDANPRRSFLVSFTVRSSWCPLRARDVPPQPPANRQNRREMGWFFTLRRCTRLGRRERIYYSRGWVWFGSIRFVRLAWNVAQARSGRALRLARQVPSSSLRIDPSTRPAFTDPVFVSRRGRKYLHCEQFLTSNPKDHWIEHRVRPVPQLAIRDRVKADVNRNLRRPPAVPAAAMTFFRFHAKIIRLQ